MTPESDFVGKSVTETSEIITKSFGNTDGLSDHLLHPLFRGQFIGIVLVFRIGDKIIPPRENLSH